MGNPTTLNRTYDSLKSTTNDRGLPGNTGTLNNQISQTASKLTEALTKSKRKGKFKKKKNTAFANDYFDHDQDDQVGLKSKKNSSLK